MKGLETIKEFFAHPIIQMALVLAASTLLLSHFSKHMFAEPLRNWELGLPAILATASQGLAARYRSSWFRRQWAGMLIVVLSTALIIVWNS